MPNDQKITRKLRAILSADVKGYSLLMADDEIHTIQTLKAYRSMMSDLIQQHSGRVVDNPGDNLLAEFSSAVDAVDCAVQIQNRLKKENAKFVEDKRLQFRIGVNIGDIVQDGDQIYGSGVNVAARIEGLAHPSGISISQSVYDQVKDKLNYEYEYLGDHELKNIEEPVRVYRVLSTRKNDGKLIRRRVKFTSRKGIWLTVVLGVIALTLVGNQIYLRYQQQEIDHVATIDSSDPSLKQHSIAVLPFENMSDDPEQEYFSDGLTDELINDLAKFQNIHVISRNSTFTYKGKSAKIRDIAEDLKVRYVLEGSVQKSKNKVRIRAQLIDGITDHHIWSESYDGILDDIFNLQDHITEAIVSVLAVKLSPEEQFKQINRGTNIVPAHDAYLKGIAHLRLWTPDDLVSAIEYFENAVGIDPNYSQAYTGLADAYYVNAVGGKLFWNETKQGYHDSQILRQHYISMAMGNPIPKTYAILAEIERGIRHFDNAMKYAKRAVGLAPNDAEVLFIAGRVLSFSGQPKKALEYLERSNRLEPKSRSARFMVCPYFLLGQYEKAISSYKNNTTNIPETGDTIIYAAASYGYLGMKEEAKNALDTWYQINNRRLSVERLYLAQPLRDNISFKILLEGLVKAGYEGNITNYTEIKSDDKLTGSEIEDLLFGKIETTINDWHIDELYQRNFNGETTYQSSGLTIKGISWIESDMLCFKIKKVYNGCKVCSDIYRNPHGKIEFKNEYLKVSYYNMLPFSIKQ